MDIMSAFLCSDEFQWNLKNDLLVGSGIRYYLFSDG